MILQIDHVLFVVPDLDRARGLWLEAGCPVLWDGVWNDPDDASGEGAPLFGVSVGPLNLELLSPRAAALFGMPPGASGLVSVAFDPGDTDETVQGLRAAGVPVGEPRPWRAGTTFVPADPAAAPLLPTGGVNTALGAGALPGLPGAFLSEYRAPHRHRGRARPDAPVRFAELTIPRPDPAGDAAAYERALGVRAVADDRGGGVLLPLRDTPLRLVPSGADAAAPEVVLEAVGGGVPTAALAAAVPGLRWRR